MGPLENLAEGVGLEPTEPEACLGRPEPRETEDSTGCPDFRAKRDTGENWDLQGLPVGLARTEREAMTEISDPGDCPVNLGPAVCWDQRDLKDPPDHLVLLEWTDTPDPKETLDLKENQAHPDSKATPVLRDSPGPREPSGPQERRVLWENQVCPECPELMALQVTLGRKDRMEIRDTWAPLAHKDLSVILGPVV